MDEKQVGIKTAIIIIVLILLSWMIMTVTFGFSSATVNMIFINSYFQSGLLIIMNFIPIILLMGFIYLISNKLWLGYSITALIFVAMGIVNRLKLTYRDDPFNFVDMQLVGESLEMSKSYDLSLSPKIIVALIGLVAIGILLKIFLPHKIESNKIRGRILIGLSIVSIIIFKGFYFNTDLYVELGDSSLVNKWVASESYKSKGLVYPFIYSMKDSKITPPKNYNPKRAEEDLNKYVYQDIPEDKKVNIIGIMLEAYNDFSEFENVELNIDVYEEFHKLQEESIHGKLVTNVFAGGTIDTERGFLTGYKNHPKYYKKTNSFLWYFKEQGYKTESMHPITGSFYNRKNVNEYMGFDNFDHYDNKYGAIQGNYLMDMEFFDYVIEGFESSKKEKQPYFHFSVTYQNHGPYADKKDIDTEYLVKKDNYNESDYNIMNNYLNGINQTGKALKKLFDRFRNEEEPVIIVFFGDHNPWLGKDNSVYNMLDINLDLEEVEGFKNYYQTPYLIWGNDAAKELLDKDFQGQQRTVSPNILMSDLFDYIGWEGNEYIQYIGDMKDKFTVNHRLFFKENGEFTEDMSEENMELWQEFLNLEHYHSYNFREHE